MNKVHNISCSLPVTLLKEKNRYVAYTPALDLSTSGKTVKHAQKMFEEAVQLFLEEIIKQDTVDEVLSELGWQKVKKEWRPPVIISNSIQKIPVVYA